MERLYSKRRYIGEVRKFEKYKKISKKNLKIKYKRKK